MYARAIFLLTYPSEGENSRTCSRILSLTREETSREAISKSGNKISKANLLIFASLIKIVNGTLSF